MKKLILLTLLTIILALSIGQVVFAETYEEKICQIATEHEKVTEAQCVIYERCCLVAIKTEKFTTKSEYDKYVDELVERVKNECNVDHVLVSRNPKVMVEIKRLAEKSATEREKYIKDMLNREIFKREPGHKFDFPKRTNAVK